MNELGQIGDKKPGWRFDVGIPGDSDYSTRWRLIKGYFSAKFDYPANEREGGLVDPLRLIHPTVLREFEMR